MRQSPSKLVHTQRSSDGNQWETTSDRSAAIGKLGGCVMAVSSSKVGLQQHNCLYNLGVDLLAINMHHGPVMFQDGKPLQLRCCFYQVDAPRSLIGDENSNCTSTTRAATSFISMSFACIASP